MYCSNLVWWKWCKWKMYNSQYHLTIALWYIDIFRAYMWTSSTIQCSMQRSRAVVGGRLSFVFLFFFFFFLKHMRKWGVHTFIDHFWWWFWICLWPVGDAGRGVNVGGRIFALQQMLCECMCLCSCASASVLFVYTLMYRKQLFHRVLQEKCIKKKKKVKKAVMVARCEEENNWHLIFILWQVYKPKVGPSMFFHSQSCVSLMTFNSLCSQKWRSTALWMGPTAYPEVRHDRNMVPVCCCSASSAPPQQPAPHQQQQM